MKIFIDPGHGGNSVGATYKGRREQDDCLRLSLAVKSILETQDAVDVKLSREDNSNPSINERAAAANVWGADYFISIHRNAFSPNKAKGVEAWVYSRAKKGGPAFTKAENIVNKVCDKAGFLNRGVKSGAPSYADFGVNRLTKMNSCLFEAGFIDSDTDNVLFDTAFSEMALGIAEGLLEAVGLEFVPPVVLGDADGDGKITAADARLILRAAVGLENIPLERGDVDGDGKITAFDARAVLKEAVNGEGNENE